MLQPEPDRLAMEAPGPSVGTWVLTRFDHCQAVLRRPRVGKDFNAMQRRWGLSGDELAAQQVLSSDAGRRGRGRVRSGERLPRLPARPALLASHGAVLRVRLVVGVEQQPHRSKARSTSAGRGVVEVVGDLEATTVDTELATGGCGDGD
ncbi:MAG: hypothetical protein ACR2G7_11275 [Acidimicrobiales bacterium]